MLLIPDGFTAPGPVCLEGKIVNGFFYEIVVGGITEGKGSSGR